MRGPLALGYPSIPFLLWLCLKALFGRAPKWAL